MELAPVMIVLPAFFRRFLPVFTVLLGTSLSGPAFGECNSENLLSGAELVAQKGVTGAQFLHDGWGTLDETPNVVRDVAVFRGAGAHLTWELSAPTPVVAIDIQAEGDDQFTISGSLDGNQWKTLWDISKSEAKGFQSRATRNLEEEVRFVRIRAENGKTEHAVTELGLYCRQPSTWPPERLTRISRVENLESTATYQAFSGKLVVALLGLFLVFVVAPRLRGRLHEAIYFVVIAMSAWGWTHFGQFQGRGVIHDWDMFHYYVGSKYYDELGNKELYRCIAKWERERGNEGRYRDILVRDLDDNTVYRFSWTETKDGRCRADFSREEWKEFGRDIELFRLRMKVPPFEHVVGDHGFNATPFHATWLGVVTKFTTPTERTLRVLAQIDSIALLAAVFSLAWGFGLPVAAVAALLIQVAAPWCYNWVGGGLGRHVWFACCCLGLAFFKNDYPGRGAAALTAAALLRLFPIVFLAGVGLYFLSEGIRSRRFSHQMKNALAGCALTIGVAVGGVMAVHGAEPFADFAHNVVKHADSPGGNRLGFPHLLAMGPGKMSSEVMNYQLTDPSQPWKEMVTLTKKERKPLWYLALAASLGVLGYAVWTIRSPWVSFLAAGPLLYSLQDMTSYDYIWLVLLVPVAFLRPRALKWLCGFAISTQVVGIAFPDFEVRHWIDALSLFPTMVVFAWELILWGRSEEEPHLPETK